MKVRALNNDNLVVLCIQPDGAVEGNLGWAVTRTDAASGVKEVLLSHICFDGQDNSTWQAKPTTTWPLQSNIIFDDTVEVGHSYTYSVQAMGGTSDNPTAIVGALAESNPVVVDTRVTQYLTVAFTRLISSQYVARTAPRQADGSYDFDALKSALSTAGNPLREHLMGNVMKLLQAPILRAAANSGHIYAALYEFTDQEVVQLFIQYVSYISLLLGTAGPKDTEDAPTLAALQNAGMDVLSRVVPEGSIAHNKTLSEVDASGAGVSYTTGAVNPTVTGMTDQASNVITILSRELAEQSVAYWNQLKQDTQQDNSQQGQTLRDWCMQQQPLVTMPDGTTVQFWASPCTTERTKPKHNPPTPPNMALLNELVDDTDELGICLQFIPGYPSVLGEIASVYPDKAGTTFLVAVSDKEAVPYQVPTLRDGDAPLFVVAGGLDKQVGNMLPVFGKLPGSFAIIHSKYYVKNPLSPNCAVQTGSHNDGDKASYSNDDDQVYISGCPRLGMYYMVDGLHVYMHYLELSQLNSGEGTFNGYLSTSDTWQADYLTGWKSNVIAYALKNDYPAPPAGLASAPVTVVAAATVTTVAPATVTTVAPATATAVVPTIPTTVAPTPATAVASTIAETETATIAAGTSIKGSSQSSEESRPGLTVGNWYNALPRWRKVCFHLLRLVVGEERAISWSGYHGSLANAKKA